MRAMILAAGRGKRLQPITDERPKPLVELGGQPLIFYHLEGLAASGFREVVINLGYLGHLLREALEDGSRWGLNIHYSQEPEDALETGGGIARALPMLGSAPFLVVNGDIYSDYSFGRLRAIKCSHAHLVLVPVPADKQHGDFALIQGRIHNEGQPKYTFSGISVYHPAFFADHAGGRWSIVPLLRKTVHDHLVTGELYKGEWNDIGTVGRLEELRARKGP